MVKNMTTKFEPQLTLRKAETTMLEKALHCLPEEDKKTVTFRSLLRRIEIIEKKWNTVEEERKQTRKAVLYSKAFKKK